MSSTIPKPPRAQGAPPPPAPTPVQQTLTLAIDVGGSRLKCGILSEAGAVLHGPVRVATPKPASPTAVLLALDGLIAQLGAFDRVSIGFPGMIRRGHVLTAPNLANEAWRNYPLTAEIAHRTGKPTRLLNDATVQGLGVIQGHGLECVITLGTGMGFALFREGRLSPQIELGQHTARNDMSYDEYVGNGALEDVGKKQWNKRVRRVIAGLDTLVAFDELHIGGGNAKYITFELPPRCRIVSNEAGITGGVRLWDISLADTPDFAPEPLAAAPVMGVA